MVANANHLQRLFFRVVEHKYTGFPDIEDGLIELARVVEKLEGAEKLLEDPSCHTTAASKIYRVWW